ncbi:MAG: hypothetical protein R3F14_06885 [Polyangiaceae bacterium]
MRGVAVSRPSRSPTPSPPACRVARAGRTSVVYEIGLFRRGSEKAAAQGHFVHVFVERSTMRPTAIPDAIRAFGPSSPRPDPPVD